MAKATLTIREVKNKVTGIDLSIPSHKVIPGLLSSTIEYHVVVVTNLAVFKSAKHKESDTVQFMISKRLSDFESFKKNLVTKFPGLILPHLPARDLIGDSSVQHKLLMLEKFLNSVATTGKLATCHLTLEFLGINPYKAGKFRSEEGSSDAEKKPVDNRYDIFETENGEQPTRDDSLQADLFTDEAQLQPDDLFATSEKKMHNSADEGIFSVEPTASKIGGVPKLFEEPDLGGAINDDEEDLFLVPGSRAERDNTALRKRVDEEDNSDLLNVEDDLDKLLKMGSKPTKEERDKSAMTVKPAVKEKPQSLPPKPGLKPKPAVPIKPGQKPIVPSKPTQKPVVAQKPKPRLVDDEEDRKESLFSEEAETDVFGTDKDGTLPKVSDVDLFALATDTSTNINNLDADGIMNYIQSNTEKGADDDLELFT